MPLLEFLYAFCILINEVRKMIRFLNITVRHAPLGQASYPLAGIPICFLHIPIDELTKKAMVSCHYRPTPPPEGQRAMPLLQFLYAFCILSTICRKHKILPSPSYMPRQASYPLARIPVCLSHSHRWTNEKKLRFLAIAVLHTPPRASELSPC